MYPLSLVSCDLALDVLTKAISQEKERNGIHIRTEVKPPPGTGAVILCVGGPPAPAEVL